MWTCSDCGCRNIAGSLAFCPVCRAPRTGDLPPQPPAPDDTPDDSKPAQSVSDAPPPITGSGGIKLPPLSGSAG